MAYWVCATPPGVVAWLLGVPTSSACVALLSSVQPLHRVSLMDYVALLGGTLVLEIPLWLAWAWCRERRARGLLPTAGWALAGNLTSHPLFVFLWLRVGAREWRPLVLANEELSCSN